MAEPVDLQPVRAFLACATPAEWVAVAAQPEQLSVLLIDHANCEKKAAATAMSLMHRYVEQHTLLQKMSRLAREELRHFEQVTKIMKKRGIAYQPISASRYAAGLRDLARSKDPGRLVDTLIIGALIEARSCERFAALAPYLDDELAAFYGSLLKSEARHFEGAQPDPDGQAALQLRNQIGGLGEVKSARGDEQNMIGVDHAMPCGDG